VDGEEQAAAVLHAAWAAGARGVVVAVPPPGELENAEDLVLRAVRELEGVSGSELTPRLLARIAELSGGRSLDLNVELVVNNARVAARVASAFSAARET
jgi:pseudouridine-5'-phosphate glycosidase